MPNLPGMRRASDVLAMQQAGIGRRALPNRVRKAMNLGKAVEYGRAEVQTARVRGAQRVAQEAMSATGALAREEAFWMNAAPHAAGRMQAIADIAAMSMADIVSETGRG